MSKDLCKNTLLLILLLYFYNKQSDDIHCVIDNVKDKINSYLSIILNDNNKNFIKKHVNKLKKYFSKKDNNEFIIPFEYVSNDEIIETEEDSILDEEEDLKIDDEELIDDKKSKSFFILNILLNKYIILFISVIVSFLIYHYKKTLNNIRSNLKKESNIKNIFDDKLEENNSQKKEYNKNNSRKKEQNESNEDDKNDESLKE